MTIKFNCEHCRKEVQAPDAAGGKRGKCPFCGTSNYIPAPRTDDDIIPLAPLDEEEERRRQREVRDLLNRERDLLAETGGLPQDPAGRSDGDARQDLLDQVVRYCLDMHAAKLPQAQATAAALRRAGQPATQAVEDLMSGKEIDPALASMPGGLLAGFLRQLRAEIAQKKQ